MLVFDDKLNCNQCLRLWKESAEKKASGKNVTVHSPQCWSRGCRNSSAQFEGIDVWIQLFNRLRGSEILKNSGAGREFLIWADGLNEETLETLMTMESILIELQEEKRKIDALTRG